MEYDLAKATAENKPPSNTICFSRAPGLHSIVTNVRTSHSSRCHSTCTPAVIMRGACSGSNFPNWTSDYPYISPDLDIAGI